MATTIRPSDGIIASGLKPTNRDEIESMNTPIANDIRKKMISSAKSLARGPIKFWQTSPIERPLYRMLTVKERGDSDRIVEAFREGTKRGGVFLMRDAVELDRMAFRALAQDTSFGRPNSRLGERAQALRVPSPGFSNAAPPEQGKMLFDYLVSYAAAAFDNVQSGEFGANMQVALNNDGPVTFWLQV